jgi:hypothetical protein
MSLFLRPGRRPLGISRGAVAASMTLAVLLAVAPARGQLVINPTFDVSITSDPNAASIEGAIFQAIHNIENTFTNPITVSIYFQEGGGLGGSLTGLVGLHYNDYYNALAANASSAVQHAAITSLGAAPGAATGNPVTGNNSGASVVITTANARALGFSGVPGHVGPGGYDSVITLNTSLTSPPQPTLNGTNYSLQSVAAHEIDEVLGVGGPGSTLGSGLDSNGWVGVEDLFRYSAPGVRSFTTVAHAASPPYFSYDGGVTPVSFFNQDPRGDFADWQSISGPHPGFTAQIQDAFATPGANPMLGPSEITALNAIGYNLAAVPEPASVALMATGALGLAGYGWRRRRCGAAENA